MDNYAKPLELMYRYYYYSNTYKEIFGMKIHNVIALNSLNKLNKSEKAMTQSMQKLSTGLRINRSADDVAGTVISQKMKSQIRGL
jgi:hypothetical protein